MQEKLKRAMPLIISGIMIVLILLIEFVTMRGRDQIDVNSFIVSMVINAAIIVCTAVAWMTSGTDRAKRDESLDYSVNIRRYSEAVTEIHEAGKLSKLKAFCELKNTEARERKINAMLSSVYLDRREYEEKYKTMTKRELQGRARQGTDGNPDVLGSLGKEDMSGRKTERLSGRQIRVILRIRQGKIRFRENRVQELMTNSKTRDDYGIHYDERLDKSLRLSIRVVKSVMIGAVLAFLIPDLSNRITDLTAWVMFVLKLITIVYTAWSAEREGF